MKKLGIFLIHVGGLLFSLGFFYGIFYVHMYTDNHWMGQLYGINMVYKFPTVLFSGIIIFWIGLFLTQD